MISFLYGFAFPQRYAKQFCLNTLPILISIRHETHYDVLKLPRSCSSKEIRDSFISLSKENHPDKNQNDPSMHIRFVKINEAYRTLIKPSSRRAYDVSLNLKRKLSPPIVTKEKSEQEFRQAYTSRHDFNDPFMWQNAKESEKERDSNTNYYGIKGIKRVSNAVIVWLIFTFMIFGVLIQIVIIRRSTSRRNAHMLEESRKNSLLESMLREKAKLYGNDYQIQILKKSLKATYDFNNTDPDEEIDEPMTDRS